MRNCVTFIVLSFIALLSVAGNAAAAPSVSGKAGTFAAGESFTITGAGFGSGNLNFWWFGANIESGVSGDPFIMSGCTNVGDKPGSSYAVDYTNTQQHSGQQSLVCHFDEGDGDDYNYLSYVVLDLDGPIGAECIYLSYWINPHISGADDDDNTQLKMVRIRNGEDQETGNQTMWAFSLWRAINTNAWKVCGTIAFRTCLTPYYAACSTWCDTFPTHAGWNFYEMKICRSSAYDEPDGIFQVALNNNDVISGGKSGCTTHYTECSEDWSHLVFGYEFSNVEAGGNYWVDVFWDDIFVAKYPRGEDYPRVMLGDNQALANCTKLDMQIPTAWESDAVTFTVNPGDFTEETTTYLFIITSSGESNFNSGEPVVVGNSYSGGGDGDGAAPTGSCRFNGEGKIEIEGSNAGRIYFSQ